MKEEHTRSDGDGFCLSISECQTEKEPPPHPPPPPPLWSFFTVFLALYSFMLCNTLWFCGPDIEEDFTGAASSSSRSNC